MIKANNINHLDEKLWQMVDGFFSAYSDFQNIYKSYEEKVLALAAEHGVDRKKLRLPAKDVASLFDHSAMEKLRDHILFPLKETTHVIFRKSDSTDEFDRYCSDIYHEMSILKEEHYTVGTYASDYEDREEAEKILDEAHEKFPVKLNQVKNLFEKAKTRITELLVNFSDTRILIRSLFLYGNELLAGVYPDALPDLYRSIYPSSGAPGGYLTAAKSFCESSFFSYAIEAFREFQKHLKTKKLSKDVLDKLSAEAAELEARLGPYME
jgi:hypothetical protein